MFMMETFGLTFSSEWSEEGSEANETRLEKAGWHLVDVCGAKVLVGSVCASRKQPFCVGFPGDSDGKESTCSTGDLVSAHGLGRYPGEGILAWRIPWTEEPGGLWSMRLQRVGQDWVTNTFTFLFTCIRLIFSVIKQCILQFGCVLQSILQFGCLLEI